jgi:hypothetical protein
MLPLLFLPKITFFHIFQEQKQARGAFFSEKIHPIANDFV